MSNLKNQLEKIDYNNLESCVYNFLANVYGWETLAEENYKEKKNSLYEIRVPVVESQDFLIDDQTIGKTTFHCCGHYCYVSTLNNKIVDYSTCIIKPSLRKDCACNITDGDVVDFENLPSLRRLNVETLDYIGNVYEMDSRNKVIVKNTSGDQVVEEFFKKAKIQKLPEEFIQKLPEDFADLIIEEKIRLMGYGFADSIPFIRYKIL